MTLDHLSCFQLSQPNEPRCVACRALPRKCVSDGATGISVFSMCVQILQPVDEVRLISCCHEFRPWIDNPGPRDRWNHLQAQYGDRNLSSSFLTRCVKSTMWNVVFIVWPVILKLHQDGITFTWHRTQEETQKVLADKLRYPLCLATNPFVVEVGAFEIECCVLLGG